MIQLDFGEVVFSKEKIKEKIKDEKWIEKYIYNGNLSPEHKRYFEKRIWRN